MRYFAYAIATLAAVAIMFSIANTAPESSTQTDANAVASVNPVSTNVMTEPGSVTIAVPDMHCEFSCFPKIKETLEATDAVEEVNLAEQKEEGTLDNRQVVVKYQAGFDADAAVKLLEDSGFEKSEIVQ